MDEYYVIKITVSQTDLFLLWNCESEPVFLTAPNGKTVFFDNINKLAEFAEKNGITLSDDITEYDLDNITVTSETLDCGEVINKWNIISDLALTNELDFSGEDKRYNEIYDKLFHGCNLPAMKHPHYTPEWSAEEIAEINRVLAEGAGLFKRIQNGGRGKK